METITFLFNLSKAFIFALIFLYVALYASTKIFGPIVGYLIRACLDEYFENNRLVKKYFLLAAAFFAFCLAASFSYSELNYSQKSNMRNEWEWFLSFEIIKNVNPFVYSFGVFIGRAWDGLFLFMGSIFVALTILCAALLMFGPFGIWIGAGIFALISSNQKLFFILIVGYFVFCIFGAIQYGAHL